jgi:hypothetical protein
VSTRSLRRAFSTCRPPFVSAACRSPTVRHLLYLGIRPWPAPCRGTSWGGDCIGDDAGLAHGAHVVPAHPVLDGLAALQPVDVELVDTIRRPVGECP